MGKYKVGVLQLDTQDNKKRNFKKIEEMVESVTADKDVKLISLPEVFDIISENDDLIYEETVSNESIPFLKELSQKYNIWVHGGSMRELIEGNDKYYNTTYVFNPLGEIKAKYRKLHLFESDIENGPAVKESDEIEKGNSIEVISTELGNLGFSICFDLRFPELYRLMTVKGAEIMFVPANFTHNTGVLNWEPLLKARAIENRCYIIAAGQTGVKPDYVSHGMSMVVDPWGRIVAHADYEEKVFIAEIDTDKILQARKEVPSLKNRRIDVYSLEEL